MLALNVNWLTPAYEAQREDGSAEWPPHPARGFCALVSVATPGSADDDALRWLESQPSPLVLAPRAVVARREGYVVTNDIKAKGDHQVHLGRTSGARSWSRALPDRPLASFVWPEADPDAAVTARLENLARRVPYFGRSTSPAFLTFAGAPVADGLEVFTPESTAPRLTRLSVPYRGYLDQLRVAFADGQPPWSAARQVPYGPSVPAPAAPLPPANRPYAHMVTLGFLPGTLLDGRLAVRVASAFKKAILSRLGAPRDGDPWPALEPGQLELLHGHYDHRDGRRQCAVTALPWVGHPKALGTLIGVAVAVSANLEAGTLRALLQLLGFDRAGGPRLDRLVVEGVGEFPLVRSDSRRTLDPDRWMGPAQCWSTVLPIVLDRYPRRGYRVEDAVAEGCVFAGLPRPVSVQTRSASAASGAPFVPEAAGRRTGEPARPMVHATLRFDREVPGPVIIGHLRHLGLGLCLPDPREARP